MIINIAFHIAIHCITVIKQDKFAYNDMINSRFQPFENFNDAPLIAVSSWLIK